MQYKLSFIRLTTNLEHEEGKNLSTLNNIQASSAYVYIYIPTDDVTVVHEKVAGGHLKS